MMRKSVCAIFVGVLLLMTSCNKKSAISSTPQASNFLSLAYPVTSRLYIAEARKIEVVTSSSQLQKAWESLVAYCGTIQCVITNSSITTKLHNAEPTGTISMRVAPADLTKLLAQVEHLGKVARDTTQREDKTSDVVDTDARIKNLTAFRDNLRVMLAKPSATIKDLVDIQQQLTETQSQLDSETAMRKILANQTEEIAVDVSFNVESSDGNEGGWADIWGALQESGSDLAESTALLIEVIVSVIPWLIIIVPGVWILVRLWRRMRGKRSGIRPPATVD